MPRSTGAPEYFLWGSIMMRITAAFAEEEIQAGPVVAHGNPKNGMTPLISSIQDDRITGVYGVIAGTAYTPIRRLDPIFAGDGGQQRVRASTCR